MFRVSPAARCMQRAMVTIPLVGPDVDGDTGEGDGSTEGLKDGDRDGRTDGRADGFSGESSGSESAGGAGGAHGAGALLEIVHRTRFSTRYVAVKKIVICCVVILLGGGCIPPSVRVRTNYQWSANACLRRLLIVKAGNIIANQ